QLPDVDVVFSNVSAGSGNYYVGLKPLESKKRSQAEIMRETRAVLARYRIARMRVTGGTDISGASSGGGPGASGGPGNRLFVMVQGPDLDKLQVYVKDLMARIRPIPGVVDVDSNFDTNKPELRINIDRARSA